MKVLKNRNFAVLFAGQTVSTFGNSLYFIALPWYVYTLTHSKADLALTGMAQSVPMLAGLFAGVFVDRWSKRWTMMGSDVIRGLLSITLFFAAWSHWSFAWILALVLLLQFVGTFFNPAAGALVPLLVDEQDVPAAAGLEQSGSAIAQLLGTAFGGALMAFLGPPLLFLFDALSFLVSIVSLLFIRDHEASAKTRADPQKPSFFKEWVEGFHLFRTYRFFTLMLASVLLANFAMAPVDIALTAWVKGPLHGDALDLGVLNAAFFLGMIAGGMGLGWVSKVLTMRRILMLGLAGSGILMIALGLWANLVWDASVIVITGFLIASLNGSVSAATMQMIPESKRGRVFGTMGALFTMTIPVGMAVFGSLMIHIPLSWLFAMMGALSIVSGLAYLLPVTDDTVRAVNKGGQEGIDLP